MGDLRNKARKQQEAAEIAQAAWRRDQGWVLFHFDFNSRLTRRGLTMGEAIRALMRVTGTKISFWRCPLRGLAVQYKVLPRTRLAYDRGETYRVLHFSQLKDAAEAKRQLVFDVLVNGIELYRAWPKPFFDEQVGLIKTLLLAPPSVDAEQWKRLKAGLHEPLRPLLDTHQADLRAHLLGHRLRAASGPVSLSMTLPEA